jgi:hypothetical protein
VSHEIQKPTDIEIPSTSLWAKLPVIGGVLAIVGLGATLAAAFGEHKARAMFSYLWAYEVVLAIALGALGFVVIEHTVRAAWSTVIRRFAETAAMTLPFFALLWVPIGFIGLHAIYPWTHEHDAILDKKRWFLSEGAFMTRAAIYFAIWIALSVILHKLSTRQDGLGNKTQERDEISRKMWRVSAVGIILYALTQSFQAIDWMMSLQPHWYSTIFGVYYFAASILAFFAFATLVALGLQKAGVLKTAITTEHFHDLGKYVFGYTIFWAYIAFSQFLIIWYASIPEETEFYMVRMEGGWAGVSYLLPILHFAVPFFFLISRHVKRSRTLLGWAAVWTLVMHAVDIYWLVLPNYGIHGEGAHHPHFAPSYLDAMALVGIAGAFLAAFGVYLNKHKVICINDPRLEESLAHENF